MPSGSPSPRWRLVISWPSMVPTVRLTLRTSSWARTGSRRSMAGSAIRISSLSRALSRPWSCEVVRRSDAPSGSVGVCSTGARSRPEAFQWSTAARGVERLDVADGLVQRAEPELGEVLADLLGDVLEEGHDVSALPE